jgi:DNA polymerase-3 subunit beta
MTICVQDEWCILSVFYRRINFVATDAHKLVKYTREDVWPHKQPNLLCRRQFNLLKSILAGSEEEVTIEYNDSNAKNSVLRIQQ